MIHDDANVEAPWRGQHVDVPLGNDLVEPMENIKGDEPAFSNKCR